MTTEIFLPIEEHRSANRYNDISTVYAWLAKEETFTNSNGVDISRKTDVFSCFSRDYNVREEREFIKDLISRNPDRYSKFVIAWSDAN